MANKPNNTVNSSGSLLGDAANTYSNLKKDIQSQQQQLTKDYAESVENVKNKEAEYQKASEYFKKPLDLPKLQLEKIPNTPQEPFIDFRNKWVALGQLVIGIATMFAAIKGSNPTSALTIYASATETIRNRMKENFQLQLEKFKADLQRIQAENQNKIAEYNAEIEKAKLGDQRAINYLTHTYNNLQLAYANEKAILQALQKTQQLEQMIANGEVNIFKALENAQYHQGELGERIRHNMAIERLQGQRNQLELFKAQNTEHNRNIQNEYKAFETGYKYLTTRYKNDPKALSQAMSAFIKQFPNYNKNVTLADGAVLFSTAKNKDDIKNITRYLITKGYSDKEIMTMYQYSKTYQY